MEREEFDSIDAYIASFPERTRRKLTELRKIVRRQAPEAQEKISYRIPTFFLHGNLVHFAGYANHVGFYPGAKAIEVFENEIKKYKFAKGSVQFPIDEPLPVALIKKIVTFRVNESVKKEKGNSKKKGKKAGEKSGRK